MDLQLELEIHKRKLLNKLSIQIDDAVSKLIQEEDKKWWSWKSIHYRERRSYAIEKGVRTHKEIILSHIYPGRKLSKWQLLKISLKDFGAFYLSFGRRSLWKRKSHYLRFLHISVIKPLRFLNRYTIQILLKKQGKNGLKRDRDWVKYIKKKLRLMFRYSDHSEVSELDGDFLMRLKTLKLSPSLQARKDELWKKAMEGI